MNIRQIVLCILAAGCPAGASSQMLLSGRILAERSPGGEPFPFTGVHVFASRDGPGSEARGFRSWETAPVGWYRISGSDGNSTAVFSAPAGWMRPAVLTNLWTSPGDRVVRDVAPRLADMVLDEKEWDPRPAAGYDQTFVARGTGVTSVGFKLAHDGVDGFGPGKQDLLVSIHRRGEGAPDSWPQVGPALPVLDVDCGGGKNWPRSVGWNSGEVPTAPGETYAVRLRARSPAGAFQAFWRASGGGPDCYRVAPGGTGAWTGRHLWMAIGADGDGILIPYNKRVHSEYRELSGFRSRWSQTWVARGRGLAGAILYAATGGTQPPLEAQRVAVHVREGGPDGPRAGIGKIAIGNGNWTGDASWGVFGAAFAPGEISLQPGRTYALEFETIETRETLGGFVNIKGQPSDERPGFNPYRKCPPDSYEEGQAFAGGTERVDFDLDLQVIEYEHDGPGWSAAVDGPDLLADGRRPAPGGRGWKEFALSPGTAMEEQAGGGPGGSPAFRIAASGAGAKADGARAQRVDGLSRADTYRFSVQVRSTWPADIERRSEVGYDLTGQEDDAGAPTIAWTALPAIRGAWAPWTSPPIRPARSAIAVWLRARAEVPTGPVPFRAEFAAAELRRVRTSVPGPAPGDASRSR